MGSILNDVKKVVNVAADYTAFDTDILMHTNTALATLHQLGVGPSTSVTLTDATQDWDVLELPEHQLGLVKTYLGLKVRMYFDPPNTSFVIGAIDNQIQELEHRLVASEELTKLADT